MSLLVPRHNGLQKQAKWLLAFIGWVIVVCQMQNSGFVAPCSVSGEHVVTVAADKALEVKGKSTSKCELSSKLVQFAKHHMELLIVVLFVGITLVSVCRVGAFSRLRQWTEPISPKHRVHLTFCVFRE